MNPKTNLVVLAGGGLLIANLFFDPQFDSLRLNMKTGKLTSDDVNTSPVHMVLVGLLTLVCASIIADDSPGAANAILVAILALWIMWLMSYNAEKSKKNAQA